MKITIVKISIATLLIASFLVCLTACFSTPVTNVILNKREVTLKEEETFTFTCTVLPSDATNKTVTWISSDTSIAVVDSNGTVTGVSSGTCMITAYADSINASAEVIVKEKGPDFKKLYNEIESAVKYGFSVATDGSYLSADTNVYNLDDYFNYDIRDAITELHEKMGLPESLDEDMWQTSWSMGKQHETFEEIGIVVSWTYHPDKGLEVTYKLLNN